MTVEDILVYFGGVINFSRQTGISAASYYNWKNWGFIPEMAQLRIQLITDGILIADLSKMERKKNDIKELNKVVRRKRGRPKKGV